MVRESEFAEECVSLGLSILLPKNGGDGTDHCRNSELEGKSDCEDKEILKETTVSNDDDTLSLRKSIDISGDDAAFYHCSSSNGDHRSVKVVSHSNFDPIMKDSSKAVFLLNGKSKGHSISETNESKLSPPPTLSNGNNEHRNSRTNDNVAAKDKDLLEYGRLVQNKALSSVFVLDNVILPLLRKGALSSSSTTQQGSNLRSSLHLTYAKKFASRVCRFTEQHERGLRLDAFPESVDIVKKDTDGSEGTGNNYSDIKVLEETANQWIVSISSVVESEINKPHFENMKSPMGEVDFWRRRHVVLSDILEQVKGVQIRSSLEVLRAAGSPLCAKLQEQINDLTKLSVEATENAKFLSTLERHLRTLCDGSIDAIVGTVPSLVDGMRMVWSVSRHYNRDERMVPLMEMVANQIVERVKKHVKLSEIIQKNTVESKDTVTKAKEVLEIWKSSYMETRTRIESMGQGQRRWEFDRARLFEITDYMIGICEDILTVIGTIDELKHFLGPNLVALAGGNENEFTVIEEVASLPNLFQNVHSDPFDSVNEKSWCDTMESFRNTVSNIEERASSSIENAFRRLRSSEGAYHLVQQFKELKSRPSIHRIIEQRYQDILQQYEKELEQIEDYFLKHKDCPPITLGHERTSGSIAWADDLYHRAKRPILLFQKQENLLNHGFGLKVKNSYLKFARSVDSYKEQVYSSWEERARIISHRGLRRSLLKVQGDDSSVADSEQTDNTRISSNQQTQNTMPSLIQVPADLYVQPHSNQPDLVSNTVGPRIQTNFSDSIRVLIKETKHFDAMGYSIPEKAMHVTLQENTFNRYEIELNKLTQIFNATIDSMSPIELSLMEVHAKSMNKVLAPGLTTLNWSSQRILTFIASALHAIEQFRSTLNEIRKHSSSIENILQRIEKESLVDALYGKGPIPLGDLSDILENIANERMSKSVKHYRSISPSIIKIEMVVSESDVGSSKLLESCYIYWTKRIHNAIIEMICRSIFSLFAMLRAFHSKSPLWCANVTVCEKEFILDPTLSDLRKSVGRLVRILTETPRRFHRWMYQTCLDATTEIEVDVLEAKFAYSFHSDISRNSTVVSSFKGFIQAFNTFSSDINDYIVNLEAVYNECYTSDLGWEAEVQKSEDSDIPLASFDNLIKSYDRKTSVLELETFQNSKLSMRSRQRLCVLQDVDISDFKKYLVDLVTELKLDVGDELHSLGKRGLESIQAKIENYRQILCPEPASFEELKIVIDGVVEIKDSDMLMELQCKNVAKTYEILKQRNIFVPEEEIAQAFASFSHWHNLVIHAKTIDLQLCDFKDDFKKVISEKVSKFESTLKEEVTNFLREGPGSSMTTLDQGLAKFDQWKTTLVRLRSIKEDLNNSQDTLGMKNTGFSDFLTIQHSMDELDQIYLLYKDLKKEIEAQKTVAWLNTDVNVFHSMLNRLDQQSRTIQINHNILTLDKLHLKISDLKDTIPMLADLQQDSIQYRHWESLVQMSNLSDHPPFKSQTLFDVLAMNLHLHKNEVQDVVDSSLQEQKIENSLQTIKNYWGSANLLTKKYKDIFILSSTDEIMIQLEDHLLNIQAMLGSKFSGVFRDEMKNWEKSLNLITECLNFWFRLQQKWMYLESIFVEADDIRTQLPSEAKLFDNTSKAFQLIMKKTSEVPNILSACSTERLHTFGQLLETLEDCQKSLTHYLNTKRAAFARFYFISDEEMISILGNSNPSSIEPHLMKVFDNVKSLSFSRGNRKIVGLGSSEGEHVQLLREVGSNGPVEIWMKHLEKEITHTLSKKMKESIFYYAIHSLETWIENNIGMCTISASQVWWTWHVEDAFQRIEQGDKLALQELEVNLSNQLSNMVTMVRSSLNDNTRQKVNSLLIIQVHARDVVSNFVRESILSVKEFEWESQLRFYWKTNDDFVIRQCIGSFYFGYEYLGLSGRLVITPLTDRCYMTLTQALTFKLGGSPSGPAGTGKTETVKDLAKSLGVPCFVVNCGEGLDYLTMASTFAGLLQSGAWGCFDEFNRINIEVLSVVSSQLKAIQNSFLSESLTVNIGVGPDIPIKKVKGCPICGVFITMNPGYAGRTELPDNLKSLFRPISMVQPDVKHITENMLFSEGFLTSRSLAKKVVTLYNLAREQLSKQYHYDFGLRSMKAVLVMAGKTKRIFGDLPEDQLMMYVLRNANMSRFVYEDAALFLGFIQDLFPGVQYPEIGDESLESAINSYITENLLNCEDSEVVKKQVDKVIQLHETQRARHATMLVGPTCGGKSTVLQILIGARRILDGTVIKTSIINPKAQELDELYGSLDVLTRDWTDGILPHIFRNSNQPLPTGRSKEERWIIFDGDVDAIWVENLNSVMDDNRLLTLPNGERIRLQPHCSLICEVYDLQYASPATVSRCGMVWVDPKNLGYKPFYERWLNSRYDQSKLKTDLMELFVKFSVPTMEYVLRGHRNGKIQDKLTHVVPLQDLELCRQLCNFLDVFLPPNLETADLDFTSLTNVYIYCVLFGVGGRLTADSRIRLNDFLFELSESTIPKCNLYEYFFCLEKKEWCKLDTKVQAYTEPSPFCFHKIFVPTIGTVLYQELLGMLSPVSPVLLVGNSGTAKTMICQRFLSSLSQEQYSNLNINMSSLTKSSGIKSFMDAKIEKRMGSVYGAPSNKKLLIFVDDMHMPQVDQFGTRQPIALLLTLLDHGFYYCCQKEILQKNVKGVQMVGAMTHSAGGGNCLDPRFISKFCLLNLPKPPEEEIYTIFNQILESRVERSCGGAKGNGNMLNGITRMSIDFFVRISNTLQASPSKFHYVFTLRDLAKVFEGLCLLNGSCYNSKNKVVRFWRNEIHRVFFDRLITENDRVLGERILDEIIENSIDDQSSREITKNPMLFLDFERLSISEKEYCNDIEADYATIQQMFTHIVDKYNDEMEDTISLVLFDFAIDHLLRVLRVIKYPKGHALLVGVGGSGKKSLTRLAAFAMGYSEFELKIRKGYSDCDLCEDLKDMFRQACSVPTVFLLSDDHIVNNSILEHVSYILNVGIPPGLFEKDEMEALCQSFECNEKTLIDTCITNLHVVITMSPSGDTLRLRCRNFPSLISACVIDWFFPWPKEALKMVAENILRDDSKLLSKLNVDDITDHMVGVHITVNEIAQEFNSHLKRRYLITPRIFIDYIKAFKELLHLGINKSVASKSRLEGGLAKLTEASQDINSMKIDLHDKKIFVDSKTQDVEQLIVSIQEKTELAEKSSKEAAKKQTAAKEQGEIIQIEKKKADAALMEALPAVEAAAEALNNIRREDLQELKAFNNPPLHVKIVCQICTILRPTGEKLDETWSDSKKMLGNAKLLEMLKEYPKESLTEKMYQRCKKILRDNKKHDITVENMSTKSQAGKGLLVWVLAIMRYYEVARNVHPLRERVKEMQKAQAKTEKELHELSCLLKELDIELNDLQKKYSNAKNELSELQVQASQMQRRLISASSLIDGLKGEEERWKYDLDVLIRDHSLITGNYLVFASFQSYLGAFNDNFRQRLIKQIIKDLECRRLLCNTHFKPEELVSSNSELQTWAANGLSKDPYSIQNGILTMSGSRFPLCIDPQEQALTWIKKCLGSSNLTIKSMKDKDYIKHLELAIEFGNPFLFQNVGEELDPVLDNVLNRNIIVTNGKKRVLIGGKTIEWDDNFRLYLCTKLDNPNYTPEIMSTINLVNYSVTRDGLAEQLLNIVIDNERPELELQYQQLINIMNSNMVILTQLENSLLKELATSTGNILDNESLITTLKRTRENASTIKIKIEESHQTKEVIEDARSSYSTISQRGSTLYFSSSGLSTINKMYELSLDTFIEQFKIALCKAEKNDEISKRLYNLITSCTERLYKFTCIGIFEQHRLAYSFNLACSIMEESNSFDTALLSFFIKGNSSLGAASGTKPSSLRWLSKNSWDLLSNIAETNTNFSELKSEIEEKSDDFLQWVQSDTPETIHIPTKNGQSFSGVEKLCLIRIFRKDRCFNATKLFVTESIGKSFIEPPTLNYREVYAQSTPNNPTIFILSKGADPQASIQHFGEQIGFPSPQKFYFVSLGQGQGSTAQRMLEAAFIRGHWIMLQNCHLLLQWVNTLESRLAQLGTPHKDFRLWLTTEPSSKFPLSLLQNSFKIVVEPPDGMRLNMQSTMNNIDSTVLENCPHPSFPPLLYCLIFLHAVLQERQKYGKLGWNISYDFNESDLTISRQLLSTYLTKAWADENNDIIPWESLKYLIGDAMYGGRVSDALDRRVLNAYFDEYFGDFLFCEGLQFQFSNIDPTYIIPNAKADRLRAYKRHIRSMPLTTNPAVIGLHGNADLKYFTDRMEDIFSSLQMLRMNVTENTIDTSTDKHIFAVACNILDSIPISKPDIGTFDLSIIRQCLSDRCGHAILPPCDIVLLQELDHWNELCITMFHSLHLLLKALKGEIGMDAKLDEISESLHEGRLPSSWTKLAPPTTKKLHSWMDHFKKRHEQYIEWIESGQPTCIWLSGLHFPQSFLSALLQTTSRQKGWALDETTFTTEVTRLNERSQADNLTDGTYVHGLYLEGASWDKQNSILIKQRSKELSTELPLIKITPIQKKDFISDTSFCTPVYTTRSRRNASGEGLVFEAFLNTNVHPSFWILQGVAIIMNLD